LKINSLERIDHPDFNDVVIHFTGRSGPSGRSPHVSSLDDWGRLKSIVSSGTFIGHEMPGVSAKAVCFTEGTSAGCSWLISQGRYTSCGVAFSKNYLFTLGGGPVIQIRGDEWGSVATWPTSIRARAVRLWPGAIAESGESLPWWLEGRSEWMFEREWRVPTLSTQMNFVLKEIAFLVIPSVNHIKSWVEELSNSNPNLAKTIASLRYVVISENGLEVSSGVRQRHIIELLKGRESRLLE
jgi:hypothetical protein